MAGRMENLKPWKPGQSGNPAGRPKKLPITEELTRLLGQQEPNGKGKSWAALIAEALLAKASKGDVRAISELADRVEGKPHRSIDVDVNANIALAERVEAARRRVREME